MARSPSVFAGRKAVLATMHGKAAAIAPVFQERLGIDIVVPADLDTDQLGTFSGEIERPGSMDEVLVAKARLGLKVSGLDLAIASEGSFGPHPHMPFIPAGLEKLVLIDAKSSLVAMEHSVDLSPSFASWETRRMIDIADQIRATGFPYQAMIVRPNNGPGALVQRGVQTFENLEAAIVQAAQVSSDGLAFVQTDMRAHFNPKRMMSIESLAKKFADRLCQTCRSCSAPGWGVKGNEGGLPCSWCGAPTAWVLHELMGCFMCDNETIQPRSDGLTEADPAHCPYCNP